MRCAVLCSAVLCCADVTCVAPRLPCVSLVTKLTGGECPKPGISVVVSMKLLIDETLPWTRFIPLISPDIPFFFFPWVYISKW